MTMKFNFNFLFIISFCNPTAKEQRITIIFMAVNNVHNFRSEHFYPKYCPFRLSYKGLCVLYIICRSATVINVALSCVCYINYILLFPQGECGPTARSLICPVCPSTRPVYRWSHTSD